MNRVLNVVAVSETNYIFKPFNPKLKRIEKIAFQNLAQFSGVV